ncbi:hypothetical protein Cgig2_008626 [Carnegiea gigantea]|uniref:Uncharacterized protein n=1 Tax=Carnegiea gigantea TaxID=171969 RepID=A0A9Q1GJQ0_9CARY|nr:hypothetical protein Cgig2_008626 [Carnegiea gigantea]
MDRDRSWMNHRAISDRRKLNYTVRVNEFLELTFGGKEDETKAVMSHYGMKAVMSHYGKIWRNWIRMDKDAKTRLFDKIKVKWNLPTEADGINVAHALELQSAKYEEFKELHMSQIEKEGADNLSLKEAYLLLMKEKLGYHRGLGPGPQPPRKVRGQSTEVRVKVDAKI